MLTSAQVNGSSIRPWWIHHHYWAMVTMAILLTLPVDSRAVQAFVRKFLWWSTFQVQPDTPTLTSLDVTRFSTDSLWGAFPASLLTLLIVSFGLPAHVV